VATSVIRTNHAVCYANLIISRGIRGSNSVIKLQDNQFWNSLCISHSHYRPQS
jgi:hypothetical protein